MDEKVAYTKTFDNKTKSQNVIVNIPSKTKYVTFKVKHSKPSNAHGVIFENPLLTNRPQTPTVNKVDNFTTNITGKAKANTTVTLKVGSKVIKEAKANSKGAFAMTVAKQIAGTTLSFYARDSKGGVSVANNIKVTKAVSPKINAKNINVINNKDKPDTVTVKGLKKNDIVKVYNSKGKLLATSKKVSGTSITMSIKQLGEKAGKVDITVTKSEMTESSRTAVSFTGEKSATIKASQVKIINNKGKADTVTVIGLKKGDSIKVYNASSKGKQLATKKATGSSVTLSIKQLGTKAGKVYITVTKTGMRESSRTAASYNSEKR